MARARAIIYFFGALIVLNGSPATANEWAEKQLAELMQDRAKLLARYPLFNMIDREIRNDCAARNAHKVATDAFCGCASALTFGFWTVGVDQRMASRLNDYLRKPTTAAARGFLKYQGPELYAGACAALLQP
jgi:hypothetical protein